MSGGTDNHLLLVDLTSKGIAGKPAAKALDQAGIELNFNSVPFDPRKPFDPSGIRLGTPALTTRGLTEEHMPQLAAWMDEAITAARQGRRGAPRPHRRRDPRPAVRLPDPRLVRVASARRRRPPPPSP